MKHRPPYNHDPKPDEISNCSAYLDRQITAIDALVIVYRCSEASRARC